MTHEKPKHLTDLHLEYLDYLRESGIITMFGAIPYLMNRFPELETDEARKILSYWMKTFGERHKDV